MGHETISRSSRAVALSEGERSSRLEKLANMFAIGEISLGVLLGSTALVLFGASKFVIAPVLKHFRTKRKSHSGATSGALA